VGPPGRAADQRLRRPALVSGTWRLARWTPQVTPVPRCSRHVVGTASSPGPAHAGCTLDLMELQSVREEYEPWAKGGKLDPDGVTTLEQYSDAVRALVGLADGHYALFRGEQRFFGSTRCQPLLYRQADFDQFEPLSSVFSHVPGAGRQHGPETVLLREEADVLYKFRTWFISTHPDVGAPAPYSSDWLALAQHYGAPTRLLDVTVSPLVALFFACWGRTSVCDEAEDGVVYLTNGGSSVRFQTARRSDFSASSEVDAEIQQGISDNYLDFFEPWAFSDSYEDVTVRYRPVAAAGETNRRLVAQSGEFVWWREIKRAAQWFPVLIPAEHKAQLLGTLDNLHVNPRTLFPDAESLQTAFDTWTGRRNPSAPPSTDGFDWTWPGANNREYTHIVPR